MEKKPQHMWVYEKQAPKERFRETIFNNSKNIKDQFANNNGKRWLQDIKDQTSFVFHVDKVPVGSSEQLRSQSGAVQHQADTSRPLLPAEEQPPQAKGDHLLHRRCLEQSHKLQRPGQQEALRDDPEQLFDERSQG
jgi:hypothetical protein